MSAQEQQRYIFGLAQDNMRFDKALSELAEGLTRSRVQNLIKDGCVELNGITCTDSARKVLNGEVASLIMPQAQEAEPQPENIPLDIVYEDDDLLVINKQPGLVVHPGAGNPDGTLVNAVLYHCGDTLSGIGGVKRPGIVHRLDKNTSGLMIVAKNDMAHQGLSDQLVDRSLSREYVAIVWGVPQPRSGSIQTQIGRHPSDRKKMAVLEYGGKEAITDYIVEKTLGPQFSLVRCRLQTGRTHQIRVHLSSLNHWLVGDPEYSRPSVQKNLKKINWLSDKSKKVISGFQRQALHVGALSFIHPRHGERCSFSCEMPQDMLDLLDVFKGDVP